MVVKRFVEVWNSETGSVLEEIADLPCDISVRRMTSYYDIICIETSWLIWLRIRWRLYKMRVDQGTFSTIYSRAF